MSTSPPPPPPSILPPPVPQPLKEESIKSQSNQLKNPGEYEEIGKKVKGIAALLYHVHVN